LAISLSRSRVRQTRQDPSIDPRKRSCARDPRSSNCQTLNLRGVYCSKTKPCDPRIRRDQGLLLSGQDCTIPDRGERHDHLYIKTAKCRVGASRMRVHLCRPIFADVSPLAGGQTVVRRGVRHPPKSRFEFGAAHDAVAIGISGPEFALHQREILLLRQGVVVIASSARLSFPARRSSRPNRRCHLDRSCRRDRDRLPRTTPALPARAREGRHEAGHQEIPRRPREMPGRA